MTYRPVLRPLMLTAALALVPVAAPAHGDRDPLHADPAGIRVTLALPAGFALLPGSARLEFTLTNRRDGTSRNAVVALVPDATPAPATPARAEPAGAEPAGGPGTGPRPIRLRISTGGQAALDALRRTGSRWQAAGQPAQSALTTLFTPCRETATADARAPLALWLRLRPEGPRLDLVARGTSLAHFILDRNLTIPDCRPAAAGSGRPATASAPSH